MSSLFRQQPFDSLSMKKVVLAATYQRYRDWCHQQQISPNTGARYARDARDLRGVSQEQLVVLPDWFQGRRGAEITEIHWALQFIEATTG